MLPLKVVDLRAKPRSGGSSAISCSQMATSRQHASVSGDACHIDGTTRPGATRRCRLSSARTACCGQVVGTPRGCELAQPGDIHCVVGTEHQMPVSVRPPTCAWTGRAGVHSFSSCLLGSPSKSRSRTRSSSHYFTFILTFLTYSIYLARNDKACRADSTRTFFAAAYFSADGNRREKKIEFTDWSFPEALFAKTAALQSFHGLNDSRILT